ncbi:MAG: hypothetical protein ABR953_10300 [Candidatus Acidiferrales bacterium]|jgi:hypothetical protein
MTEKVNSIESLETLLKELEPQLPFGVHYLGALVGCNFRYCTYTDGPKDPPPNPIRNDPFGSESGFYPLIVGTELFRPIQRRLGGWLYTIHFVLDDLLTAEEVRSKVREAAAIFEARRGKTCTWKAYKEELNQIEREGFSSEPLAN